MELVFVAPILVYFWYMVLKPVRRAIISEGSQITFTTGLGSRSVMISSIRTIQPFLGSRENFTLIHENGSELLFSDPTMVALLARDIRAVTCDVAVRGVSDLPGESGS